MFKDIIDVPKMDLLKAFYSYNSATGILTHKYDNGKVKAGDNVGYLSNSTGYYHTDLLGINYLVHRLIYARANGHLCLRDMELTHIDQDKSNNRLSNLRLTKPDVWKHNKAVKTNNKSGVTGVLWCKRDKRWVASITVNKKRIALGGSNQKSIAIQLRLDAEAKYDIN